MNRNLGLNATMWLIPALFSIEAQAADESIIMEQAPLSAEQEQALARSIERYWTPERMTNAIPMPVPGRIMNPNNDTTDPNLSEPLGQPGGSPGSLPAGFLPDCSKR